MFEIESTPELGTELLERWAEAFPTSVDLVAQHVGLPLNPLKSLDSKSLELTHTRLLDIHKLLCRVRPWFNSDKATWEWFINEPLAPFNGLTPSDVVKSYHNGGIEALHEWVDGRELGGFQ
ncbi:hypothetical protein ACFQ45_16940 [Rhodanobacter aciditrophus]|uniref:Antitoxin Xre/MbcA/ParS-like toxin-binding domain-containing protein n=1 Tax=Rhodanobacter aciditrophus TaxID=1623218 RepID=A0ABW4B4N1_9GAMM